MQASRAEASWNDVSTGVYDLMYVALVIAVQKERGVSKINVITVL